MPAKRSRQQQTNPQSGNKRTKTAEPTPTAPLPIQILSLLIQDGALNNRMVNKTFAETHSSVEIAAAVDFLVNVSHAISKGTRANSYVLTSQTALLRLDMDALVALAKSSGFELAKLKRELAGSFSEPWESYNLDEMTAWGQARLRQHIVSVLMRAPAIAPLGQAPTQDAADVAEMSRLQRRAMWRQLPDTLPVDAISLRDLVLFRDNDFRMPALPEPQDIPKPKKVVVVEDEEEEEELEAEPEPQTAPARRSNHRTRTLAAPARRSNPQNRSMAAPGAVARSATSRFNQPVFSHHTSALPLKYAYDIGSKCFGLAVDYAKNAVYVGCEAGIVAKVNAVTGEQVSAFHLSDGVRCIVSDESFVFVGCNNGSVYDITTDTPRLVAEIEGFTEIMGITMHRGMIVASDASGQIAMLNCEGEVVWKKQSGPGGEGPAASSRKKKSGLLNAIKDKLLGGGEEGAAAEINNGWMSLLDDGGVFHGHKFGVTKYDLNGAKTWHRETAGVLLGQLSGDQFATDKRLFVALEDPNCFDGEIGKRLEREGAKSGEVVVSLMWNNRDDLDLQVRTPDGHEISYSSKHSPCGGCLDVDMNAGGQSSDTPVENIYWSGKAPLGKYIVRVNQYNNRTSDIVVPFEVYVNVRGEKKKYSMEWKKGLKSLMNVCEFTVDEEVAAEDDKQTTGKLKAAVVALNNTSGEVVKVYPVGSSAPSTTCSADGQKVFAGVKNGVVCFNADTQKEEWRLRTTTAHNASCSPVTLQCSPDGSTVFALCGTQLNCIDVSPKAVKDAQNGNIKGAQVYRRDTSAALTRELSGVDQLQSHAGDGGIEVRCVKEGSKLRVRVVPGQAGYDSSLNIQFPRNIRQEGSVFVVDGLVKVSSGRFYRVQGSIFKK